jgi:hypothetical protein
MVLVALVTLWRGAAQLIYSTQGLNVAPWDQPKLTVISSSQAVSLWLLYRGGVEQSLNAGFYAHVLGPIGCLMKLEPRPLSLQTAQSAFRSSLVLCHLWRRFV